MGSELGTVWSDTRQRDVGSEVIPTRMPVKSPLKRPGTTPWWQRSAMTKTYPQAVLPEIEEALAQAERRRSRVIATRPSTQELMNKLRCAVCGELAKQLCQNCQSATYCSRQCQKVHWSAHRQQCSVFGRSPRQMIGAKALACRDWMRVSTALPVEALVVLYKGSGLVCARPVSSCARVLSDCVK